MVFLDGGNGEFMIRFFNKNRIINSGDTKKRRRRENYSGSANDLLFKQHKKAENKFKRLLIF